MGTATVIKQHITVPILGTGKPNDVKKYIEETQRHRKEFIFQ
jgi:hypothetical protein